jgi:GT2 family glycosyltransferase
LRNDQRLDESHYAAIVTANAAYRKSVLELVGGFDDRMRTGGDIDLAWRVQRQKLGDVVYVPEAVVLHQHRSTLDGMHHQFRRYGYCSAMMTALHHGDAAYPQPPAWQARQVEKQIRALLTYLLSLLYRNTVGLVQRRSPYERHQPFYWLVAESGALRGRLAGMLETRLFHRLPTAFLEQDR